jgi:hypothetical protein
MTLFLHVPALIEGLCVLYGIKIPSASISDIATMEAGFPTRVAVEFHLLNCLIYLIFCYCSPVIRFCFSIFVERL